MYRNPKVLLSVLFVFISSLVYSLPASASFALCLKKEISNDGVAWYDANQQSEAVLITDSAHFRFTVSKCPSNPGGFTDIWLTDPQLELNESIETLPHSYDLYPDRIHTVEVPGYCEGVEGYKENVATVEGINWDKSGSRSASDNAWAMCEDIPVGGEGCTPGYWRQSHHFDSWPVDVNTTFAEVFGRDIEIRVKKQGTIYTPTLYEALRATGGQVNMAARHAVAAYLNSMNDMVSYDMTPQSVVEAFQTSYDDGKYGVLIENLVDLNEQGCPLN